MSTTTIVGKNVTVKHNLDVDQLTFMIDKIVTKLVMNSGEHVLTEIKKKLNKGKSPPPSVSPDPPRNRTGSLIRSFRSRTAAPVKEGDEITYTFGTNAKYALPLELGAKLPGGQPFFKDDKGNVIYASRQSPHAWRMAKTKPGILKPRPFFGVTVNSVETQNKITNLLNEAALAIRHKVRQSVRPIV
jgi:hypothetical protein|tara:strand:+ start:1421 stop:1981 length:561 start_codon:yes stop_codon:yes gene_type:complete